MSVFEEILSEFKNSPQGAQALQALQAQGYSASDASALLEHATSGAAASMAAQTENHPQPTLGLFNLFGGHAAREFLVGLTAGILRGDGFVGSFEDGAMSMVSGHVGEVIAERAGVDPTTAGTIAAAVTPFIVHYAHEKLAEMHG